MCKYSPCLIVLLKKEEPARRAVYFILKKKSRLNSTTTRQQKQRVKTATQLSWRKKKQSTRLSTTVGLSLWPIVLDRTSSSTGF